MDKNIVTKKILFKATVSGTIPRVFANKINKNNIKSQFRKFIFLKNKVPFIFSLKPFKKELSKIILFLFFKFI